MSKLGTLVEISRTFGVRDGMLRLGYELQRGSGLMSHRMRSVQGWPSWDLKLIAPGASPHDLLHARRNEGRERSFFFADSRALENSLKDVIGAEEQKCVLTEAQNILAGRLPFFGRLTHACGFPPDWFQNPVTKQRVSPDRPWTQMRFASADYGDLKFILEPSRFLFVYPLARAYALSGDDRLAEGFWIAIEDWARHSPPMAGPLWICGQESSLRILAWSFGLHAFIHSPATTAERVALLVSMVAAHAWRTEQTLGYARSQRSNHLVSEAVGLWTAGTLYPELEESAAWQDLGARLLREAVVDQITPEGACLQHSFNYHRMVLQLLLWTLRLAEINRVQLPPEIRTRAAAAYEFMAAFVDPASGHAPNYGANDGSLVFPLTSCEYGDYRPTLQMGASVLDRPALAPGPWDEAALWIDGKRREKAKTTASLPAAPVHSVDGYYHLGENSSWALVRAGHYDRRPFHADQLHVDLWWRGLNLARDAGTYLYNGDPPWNNRLSGTAVHNTVTLDHQDQMRRAGRFLWVDWAQASGRSFSTMNGASPDCFEGEHDGYRRLGVKHRRRVQYIQEAGWVIVDDLVSGENAGQQGEHQVRLHWLLADLPLVDVSYSTFQAVFAAKQSQISWSIFSDGSGSVDLIRAGKNLKSGEMSEETQLLGWDSPTYSELRPAISIVYQTRTRLPLRLITVVLTEEGLQLERDSDHLSILQGSSRIYQVGLRTEIENKTTPRSTQSVASTTNKNGNGQP